LISIGYSWIDDYKTLSSKDTELKELYKEYSKKTIYNPESTDNVFSTQLETDDSHDRLLDICVSAFTPGSYCCDNLGYCFITSEPLKELGVKNFDALILKQSTKYAIFVECKSSISSGEVTDGYKQIQEIISKKPYLEQQIGNEINTIDFVFCVRATKVQQLAKQIEMVEKSKKIDSDKDPVFLLWQVEMFTEQTLQLVSKINISTRKKEYHLQHKDNELTKVLGKGMQIPELEYIPRLYPSSNPYTQGRTVISKLFNENDINVRLRKHNIDDKKQEEIKKTITEKRVYDFFQSKNNITHYDSVNVGKNLADHFIGESLNFGILKQVTSDSYLIDLEGKKLDTILNNYKKKYKENFLENQTKKKAYDEYLKMHPKLPGL